MSGGENHDFFCPHDTFRTHLSLNMPFSPKILKPPRPISFHALKKKAFAKKCGFVAKQTNKKKKKRGKKKKKNKMNKPSSVESSLRTESLVKSCISTKPLYALNHHHRALIHIILKL